tara:strand:+ start:466 stop:849 length:384 start_codon:yes stop_codon:yes gene_type:complete
MKRHNGNIIDSKIELHPVRRYQKTREESKLDNPYYRETFEIRESNLIRGSGLNRIIKNAEEERKGYAAREMIKVNLPKFIRHSLEGACPFAPKGQKNDILYRLPIEYQEDLPKFKKDFLTYLSERPL